MIVRSLLFELLVPPDVVMLMPVPPVPGVITMSRKMEPSVLDTVKTLPPDGREICVPTAPAVGCIPPGPQPWIVRALSVMRSAVVTVKVVQSNWMTDPEGELVIAY